MARGALVHRATAGDGAGIGRPYPCPSPWGVVMQQKAQVLTCPAITRTGERCQRHIGEGADFCHLHDPSRADERRVLASKARRSRPLSESAALRKRLTKLLDEVLEGNSNPKVAGAVSVLANAIIGTLRLDVKVR